MVIFLIFLKSFNKFSEFYEYLCCRYQEILPKKYIDVTNNINFNTFLTNKRY